LVANSRMEHAVSTGSSFLRHVAVFCGASVGGRGAYADGAGALGRAIAQKGATLVYGGGRAGLMGAVADAALGAGGQVVGVITKLLVGRELGHNGITDLKIVESMHERKMLMAEMADTFIALPGGLGTLDELFEILAWAQLGIHSKPVGLLNTDGYYDPLMAFLDKVETEGFLRLNHRTVIVMDEDARRLLDRLGAVIPHSGRPIIV
jgi:uncharacterized protein (TIGR00730 family)